MVLPSNYSSLPVLGALEDVQRFNKTMALPSLVGQTWAAKWTSTARWARTVKWRAWQRRDHCHVWMCQQWCIYIHTTLSSYINTTVSTWLSLLIHFDARKVMILPSYSIPKAFYDHMIINEAMQKRHGCHLQVTVVNVNAPSGEDGAAIEIERFHGHPASFLDTRSHHISSYLILSHLISSYSSYSSWGSYVHMSLQAPSPGHRHLCHTK